MPVSPERWPSPYYPPSRHAQSLASPRGAEFPSLRLSDLLDLHPTMSGIVIQDAPRTLPQDALLRVENEQETTERLLIMVLIFVVSLTGTSLCLADPSHFCRSTMRTALSRIVPHRDRDLSRNPCPQHRLLYRKALWDWGHSFHCLRTPSTRRFQSLAAAHRQRTMEDRESHGADCVSTRLFVVSTSRFPASQIASRAGGRARDVVSLRRIHASLRKCRFCGLSAKLSALRWESEEGHTQESFWGSSASMCDPLSPSIRLTENRTSVAPCLATRLRCRDAGMLRGSAGACEIVSTSSADRYVRTSHTVRGHLARYDVGSEEESNRHGTRSYSLKQLSAMGPFTSLL